jgi:hypothetical protein
MSIVRVTFGDGTNRAESARDLIGQEEEDWSMCDPRETRGLNLPPEECHHVAFGPDGERTGTAPRHYAYPPFFFLSCVMMAVLAGVAIVRRRLGGLVAFPRADGLVRAMDATSPATRAAFTLQQLFSRSLDAALPCLELLGVLDPA